MHAYAWWEGWAWEVMGHAFAYRGAGMQTSGIEHPSDCMLPVHVWEPFFPNLALACLHTSMLHQRLSRMDRPRLSCLVVLAVCKNSLAGGYFVDS